MIRRRSRNCRFGGPDDGAVLRGGGGYALAYLGFAAPYLVDGLGALAGKTGAFVALTAIVGIIALVGRVRGQPAPGATGCGRRRERRQVSPEPQFRVTVW
jgi:hypothetical protein